MTRKKIKPNNFVAFILVNYTKSLHYVHSCFDCTDHVKKLCNELCNEQSGDGDASGAARSWMSRAALVNCRPLHLTLKRSFLIVSFLLVLQLISSVHLAAGELIPIFFILFFFSVFQSCSTTLCYTRSKSRSVRLLSVGKRRCTMIDSTL